MKVTVPTSLRDIKLSTYLQYLKQVDYAKNKEDSKGYIITQKLMLFCNLTMEEVGMIPYDTVTGISETIDVIISSTPPRSDFIKLGNKTFGWVPSLDDLNWGEFLDLNSNISDWDTIHIALGVLYRPIILKYKGKYAVEKYKGDKYHNLIKEMPMDIVVSSMVFFWNLGMDCAKSTLLFLGTEQQRTDKTNSSMQSGDGMAQSMSSLVEMLQSMKKSIS